MNQIKDYLQTQGLKLNPEEVHIARLAIQTVMQQGQAVIEPKILFHDKLPENINTPQHEERFKRIFMALDSAITHYPIQTAVVYALLPEQQQLVRLSQQGQPIEQTLDINEEAAWQFLAVRSAHSGWLNIIEDNQEWLQQGELKGEHNLRAKSQMSLPICAENGQVFGILHLEAQHPFTEEQQTYWVGVALALLVPLQSLGLTSLSID